MCMLCVEVYACVAYVYIYVCVCAHVYVWVYAVCVCCVCVCVYMVESVSRIMLCVACCLLANDTEHISPN